MVGCAKHHAPFRNMPLMAVGMPTHWSTLDATILAGACSRHRNHVKTDSFHPLQGSELFTKLDKKCLLVVVAGKPSLRNRLAARFAIRAASTTCRVEPSTRNRRFSTLIAEQQDNPLRTARIIALG